MKICHYVFSPEGLAVWSRFWCVGWCLSLYSTISGNKHTWRHRWCQKSTWPLRRRRKETYLCIRVVSRRKIPWFTVGVWNTPMHTNGVWMGSQVVSKTHLCIRAVSERNIPGFTSDVWKKHTWVYEWCLKETYLDLQVVSEKNGTEYCFQHLCTCSNYHDR